MKEIMNLADPELELIDPTPNIHMLFIQFDKTFFYTKLASRAVVRWSKRMYSCAGICSYDRGGLCDIALSEPLLKLRPRKDLIETLLHEMIHAYLFVTCQDQDRDGHGPNFKSHMYRINRAAGLNISIYHDFHDEVKLYQTHWWRCNGPCQTRKPHFGIVRRSMNRAPGPTDCWWSDHLKKCGGTFIKIKEPENFAKKKAAPKANNGNGDITKYINTKNKGKAIKDDKSTKPILKESNNVPVRSNFTTKSNGSGTIVVSKKTNVVFNPQVVKHIEVFSGKGQTLSGRSSSISDIAETVRNIWANKQIPSMVPDNKKQKKGKEISRRNSTSTVTGNKHKANDFVSSSPPSKIKKIDDYFKTSAKTVLKDLYGQDFVIKEVNANKRLSVVPVQIDLVECPVCNNKIVSSEVNRHLDECLNKEIIENISKDNPSNPVICSEDINKFVKVGSSKNDNIKTEKPMISKIKEEFNDLTYTVDINANYNKKIIKSKSKIDIQTEAAPIIAVPVTKIKTEPKDVQIKIEPGTSRDAINNQKCPCCEKEISNTMNEHLDECLAFFNDNSIPEKGASTSAINETIVIDDDDDLDETLTLNATGTKSPCPCCLAMIEQADMNEHLDLCLN